MSNARQVAVCEPDISLAGTVDHVVANPQAEFVCGAEVRVTRKLHDLELTETPGQPVADRRSPQIAERAMINARTPENLAESNIELRDECLTRIGVPPLALAPQHSRAQGHEDQQIPADYSSGLALVNEILGGSDDAGYTPMP